MSVFGSRSRRTLGTTAVHCSVSIKQHILLLYHLRLVTPAKQLQNLLQDKLDNEYPTKQQKEEEWLACLKAYLLMLNTSFSLIDSPHLDSYPIVVITTWENNIKILPPMQSPGNSGCSWTLLYNLRVRQWKLWKHTHEPNVDGKELQFPRLECTSR